MRSIALGLTFAFASAFYLQAHADDSVAAFYKGKQIFLQIGSETGGGYDVVGRAVARHIAAHIPGNPTIVVQNVPGGGSLKLGNQFYAVAPRDGSVFGLASNGMPTTPLLNPGAAHFDPRNFYWLGSTSREVEVLIVWHEAPVKTLDDVFTKEMIVGASAPGSATWDFPLATNALLGTKFKIVTGYRGATQVKLAMEQGEVHANAALAWGSAKTNYADLLRDKKMRIIAQYGAKASDLPDVPLMPRAKSDADNQILDILYARSDYGRPFFLPQGVPADRAAALRRAFADTMKDPSFRADAQKVKMEFDPVTGEALEALTKRLMAMPESVAARARAILSPGGEKK